MAEDAKLFIRGNWITLANLILLITIVAYLSRWQERTDNRLERIEQHAIDKEVHMSFKEKIQVFVPRVELDSRLLNIEKSLDEIKKVIINKKN